MHLEVKSFVALPAAFDLKEMPQILHVALPLMPYLPSLEQTWSTKA